MMIWYIIICLIYITGYSKANIQPITDFVCVDGSQIKLEYVCDGEKHCPDGSDEVKELCYHVICPPTKFRCHYGACVNKVTLCNKKFECADKSDESQCGAKFGSCEKNEFRCKNGQCININKMCDDVKDCRDGSDESKETCEELPCPDNSFHCKHGGCIHLQARCNGHSDCIDGSDESAELCRNLKCPDGYCPDTKVSCPAITFSRIDVTCEHPTKGLVPCAKPIPIGTIAKYNCKSYYQPSNHKHIKNTKAVCQPDGTWSRELLKCEPDCGKAGPDGVPMVVKGWKAKVGGYPWHAALFVKEDGKWDFWCGGSLISESAVLTAGHCTWNINAKDMKVALGKFSSDITKNEDFTKIIQVKEIRTQPLYQDQNGNYGSDISILVLENAVDFSPYIRPVCLDWHLEDMHTHLTENSTGLIVGMGVTEDDSYSEYLRGTYLPVVSNEKCIDKQKQDFRKYITYTSFCAGWQNGTGVCNGDSGGGLVFKKPSDPNIWVLQGLVSISPRRLGTSYCDPKYFTVFTKVSMFLEWVKDVLDSIHVDRAKSLVALGGRSIINK